MQRTLITLGLTLLLFSGACGDPGASAEFDGAHTASDGGTICTLSVEECAAFDGVTRNDGDASAPSTTQDAGMSFGDAAPAWDAESAGDAGIAEMDASMPDGNSTLTNPCDVMDCHGPAPISATCGNGDPSAVVCKPSFFGDCEWHLDCGTP